MTRRSNIFVEDHQIHRTFVLPRSWNWQVEKKQKVFELQTTPRKRKTEQSRTAPWYYSDCICHSKKRKKAMPPVKPKYQTIADGDVNYDTDAHDATTTHTIDDTTNTTTTTPPKLPILEVIILDFTHARFTIELPGGDPATSTVRDLKAAGSRHHSVTPHQQRLIYQGKLLADENASLQECGIHHGSIVHLFPKPRVVVVNTNNQHNTTTTTTGRTASSADEPTTNTSTAELHGRVPTIVVDEAEHARRGQILVLGSADYLEAVNNVKLFSFMLLIISTIELLNLIAVALGEGDPSSLTRDAIPYKEIDDFFPSDDDTMPAQNTNSNNENNYSGNTSTNNTTNAMGNNPADPYTNPYQTWNSLSWVDLGVSVLGIYVALLGIRASNDNVLAVARLYLIGTIITGMGWLVYNFIINYEIDQEVQQQQDQQQQHQQSPGRDPHSSMPMNNNNYNNSSDSVFNQAVQAMVLPAVVWGLCMFRAWQFQHLLAEAEQEAMERVGHSSEEEEESDNDNDDEEQQALQSPPAPRTIIA